MRDYFEFNGVSSLAMGLQIEGEPVYHTGSKIVERYTVPGRPGTLIYDTGAYSNSEAAYTVSLVGGNIEEKLYAITAWLCNPSGYARLEDTQEPDVFRLAYCDEPLEFVRKLKLTGKGDIHFNCMPQRYLKSGDEYEAVVSGDTLTNDYLPARPLIEVTGSSGGTLTINETVMTFSNVPTTLTVDCENCLVYAGTTNYSSLVSLSGYEFPVLKPGANTVAFSGGITGIRMKPRWWTL